jgi:hypothetical protein
MKKGRAEMPIKNDERRRWLRVAGSAAVLGAVGAGRPWRWSAAFSRSTV